MTEDFACLLIRGIIDQCELLVHHDLEQPEVRDCLMKLASDKHVQRVFKSANNLYADQK